MSTGSPADPFRVGRDPREQVANDLLRDYFLSPLPGAVVHRQHGGYALIAPQSSGARTLTVPAANEADFMFHGDPAESGAQLADFVAQTIGESGVDHLRLPLLVQEQAVFLRDLLTQRLPDWVFAESLSSISPVCATNPRRLPESFRRAVTRAERSGIVIGLADKVDLVEVAHLHALRWGAGNRSATFFGMLAALVEAGSAEYLTARDEYGVLVGAQLDICGSRTRHFYYSVSDREESAGLGTAVMAASWRRFVADIGQIEYSFGRGSERYKYRYADGFRAWFDLRGFYAPGRRKIN